MEGTYWGIGSATSSYESNTGYSKALATEVIAGIRTDLDSFSDAEAAILENHGYLLADAAVKNGTCQCCSPLPFRRWVPEHPELDG